MKPDEQPIDRLAELRRVLAERDQLNQRLAVDALTEADDETPEERYERLMADPSAWSQM